MANAQFIQKVAALTQKQFSQFKLMCCRVMECSAKWSKEKRFESKWNEVENQAWFCVLLLLDAMAGAMKLCGHQYTIALKMARKCSHFSNFLLKMFQTFWKFWSTPNNFFILKIIHKSLCMVLHFCMSLWLDKIPSMIIAIWNFWHLEILSQHVWIMSNFDGSHWLMLQKHAMKCLTLNPANAIIFILFSHFLFHWSSAKNCDCKIKSITNPLWNALVDFHTVCTMNPWTFTNHANRTQRSIGTKMNCDEWGLHAEKCKILMAKIALGKLHQNWLWVEIRGAFGYANIFHMAVPFWHHPKTIQSALAIQFTVQNSAKFSTLILESLLVTQNFCDDWKWGHQCVTFSSISNSCQCHFSEAFVRIVTGLPSTTQIISSQWYHHFS